MSDASEAAKGMGYRAYIAEVFEIFFSFAVERHTYRPNPIGMTTRF